MNAPKTNRSWLTYINLSDPYERKARFAPGLLAIMFCLPAAMAYGIPIIQWLGTLAAGIGFSVVISIGISHFASAMGNDLQKKLWPRWPHDSPTHTWLRPDNDRCSAQQRQQWNAAIKTLTGLDLASVAADDPQLDPLINDAVAQLRNKLWQQPVAARMDMHNTDYGFARNFTGLRPIWLSVAAISMVACWIAPLVVKTNYTWPIIATALAAFAFFLAFSILPNYVRIRADYYAESFFAAVVDLAKTLRDIHEPPAVQ